MPVSNVIIVKLLNVPIALLQKFPVTAYSILDRIAVMTLQPNLDLIKRKPSDNASLVASALPMVLHLVFDDGGVAQGGIAGHAGATDFQVAHWNAEHFESFEEFSSFVIELMLPDLHLPEEFWIPVQSVLTYRELEILYLVYQGFSSKQIAGDLTVSPRTIELHRQNCSGKIGQITPQLLEALFSTTVLHLYDWAINNQIVGNGNQASAVAVSPRGTLEGS